MRAPPSRACLPLVVATLMFAALAPAAGAQVQPPGEARAAWPALVAESARETEGERERSWPLLSAAGIVGGAAGFFGTFHLTLRALEGCQGGGCAIPLVLLPVGGEIVGVAAGVYLASRRRTEFVEVLGASVISTLLGAVVLQGVSDLAGGGDDASTAVLLMIPAVQVAATAAWVRWGSAAAERRRERGGAVEP